MKQKVVTAVSVAALAGISVIGIGFFAEPFTQTKKTPQAAVSQSADVVKETVFPWQGRYGGYIRCDRQDN